MGETLSTIAPDAWSGEAKASVGGIQYGLWNAQGRSLPRDATHFGYATTAGASLACAVGRYTLAEGMYFRAPGPATLEGGAGLLVSVRRDAGVFMLAGPIEARGRLRYIDGCSDSLLIPPQMRGDPCLNFLHFPPQIAQTMHVHPSDRIGIVARGRGECHAEDGIRALAPGTVFRIPAGTRHAFRTRSESMAVVVYHPDSDSGPTHDDHPMLNRTFIDGESVAGRKEIRSGEDAILPGR